MIKFQYLESSLARILLDLCEECADSDRSICFIYMGLKQDLKDEISTNTRLIRQDMQLANKISMFFCRSVKELCQLLYSETSDAFQRIVIFGYLNMTRGPGNIDPRTIQLEMNAIIGSTRTPTFVDSLSILSFKETKPNLKLVLDFYFTDIPQANMATLTNHVC